MIRESEVRAESKSSPINPLKESSDFLSRQLITCIGNKRRLLSPIRRAVRAVCADLQSDKLRIADLFSGSGAVSRLCMQFAKQLIANDLERYPFVINRCYLCPPEPVMWRSLVAAHRQLVSRLTEDSLYPGIIAHHYAPADDADIRPGERVFYTRRNACFLDSARALIADLDPALQPYLLAPLLAEASVHANTAGVFKGFYKDRQTGVGKFGGAGGDALRRITGAISLELPVTSRFSPQVDLHQKDANELVDRLPPLDLVYLDPPYNQHPYGSNYFMLNLLCDYRPPEEISEVSGIPAKWTRSDYNRRRLAEERLEHLVRRVDSSHVLLSFNSEGFISPSRLVSILEGLGRVSRETVEYPVFRGSRNLSDRSHQVEEGLYLLRK